MIVPDVKCVLGETLAMQDAWRRGFEGALSQRVLDVGAEGISSADERAEWTAKMEILSGGRNTIKWVDDGGETPKYFPTIMVKFNALRIRDLLENSTNEDVHPAFRINNKIYSEIFVGKYQMYQISSGSKNIGVSLYGMDPKTHITFGASFSVCGNGGAGHHLITNAERAMIALLAKNVNMYQPKGNNFYGKDGQDPNSLEYYGVPTRIIGSRVYRVGTGTGPLSWSHDGTPWGVYDMNGNVWEWCSGLRLAAGEIQVIPNNDAAINDIDVSRDSTLWKAIRGSDGTLVTPEVVFSSDTDTNPTDNGAGQTLKYDATNPISITTNISTRPLSYVSCLFDDVYGVDLPEIIATLCLAPEAPGERAHDGDEIGIRNDDSGNYSETISHYGKKIAMGSSFEGVFCLMLNNNRSTVQFDLGGARSAFARV